MVMQGFPLLVNNNHPLGEICTEDGQDCIGTDCYDGTQMTENVSAEYYYFDHGHEAAVGDIQFQLSSYCEGQSRMLSAGGGTEYLPEKEYTPDTAICPYLQDENPRMPCLTVKIEVLQQGIADMLASNAQVFAGIPQLRASVLLKVYRRHAVSRRFAALAILSRRSPDGAVIAADAVSCGTAPLDACALDRLPPAIRCILRALPAPPAVSRESPWPPTLNPTITVPAADLFYWHDDADTGDPVLVPGTPPDVADLKMSVGHHIRSQLRQLQLSRWDSDRHCRAWTAPGLILGWSRTTDIRSYFVWHLMRGLALPLCCHLCRGPCHRRA